MIETAIPIRKIFEGPGPRPDAPGLLQKSSAGNGRIIVVLDDDPTGIQTVHDVFVYTRWDEETVRSAFQSGEKMFFLLTNSRGLTAEESRLQHEEIAANIAAVAGTTGKDFIVISRGDSTLRGHWPMETETLRTVLEEKTQKQFDGEILIPFFPEGGRYTWHNIHYVRQGDRLIPAGQTEFAGDKSFGYTSSNLCEWIEEKSAGRYPAGDVCVLSREELRQGDPEQIAGKLSEVKDFGKIIVNCTDYADLQLFAAAFWQAVKQGHEYLFRSAAALPKVLGGVEDRPLLQREELVDPGNSAGGIILIGSHVNKTTRQLEQLRQSEKPMKFIEFDQHRVLEKNGLELEVERVLELAEEEIRGGRTAVIYTRRQRLDLETEDPDRQLQISTQISDAVTSIIGRLQIRPAFIVAKGGITSSDVGTKALKVRKALAKGQIRPGIPVWQTGEESRFPDMPYVIFPGNVGTEEDLRLVAETLIP